VIVCFCRGLSESDLRAVVAAGASTVDDVSNACGAATDCGACRLVVVDVVAEASGSSLANATR
jgi:bacterioferritin-associated ferredoxin